MSYKQVIVVRSDVSMGKGKLAVQVAHASLEAYKKADAKSRIFWEGEGCKKVVVKVSGVDALLEVHKNVRIAGLPCSLIKDAGKTQIASGTITAVGIGPSQEEVIDKITKDLKLL